MCFLTCTSVIIGFCGSVLLPSEFVIDVNITIARGETITMPFRFIFRTINPSHASNNNNISTRLFITRYIIRAHYNYKTFYSLQCVIICNAHRGLIDRLTFSQLTCANVVTTCNYFFAYRRAQ